MSALPFDALLAHVRQHPARADLATELALQALQNRREEDALPAVRAAAAVAARDDPTPLHLLGLLYRATGDLAAAITAFDRALPLAPASARLLHARARAAAEAGLLSLDWYARARAVAPHDPELILGQVAALYDARDDDAAETLLIGFLRQNPDWIAGHATLIRLRTMTGAGDAAYAELDRALAVMPRDAALHDLKIVALTRGDGDAAKAALARALAILGPVPALRRLGAIVATEHDTVDAADAAFAGLDPCADPDLAVHWFRHLLRRRAPEQVASLYGKLPPEILAVAWPYLSLAWRLTDDPRGAWLDRDAFVQVIDLGPPPPALGAALRDLHRSHAAPLDQSVRGGTQTDGPLFSRVDPAIRSLRAMIDAAVRSYIAALPPADPAHPLLGRIPRHPRFVGSWSVRLRNGGFHTPHVHGEGWLSSAFYVSLPDTVGEEGWLTLGQPQDALGLDLRPSRIVEPRPGRLVLFPSTMWHGTRPFPRGERLTVAFDIG